MQIDVAYDSLIKHGEELCGDNVQVVKLPDRTVMALTDGLGSGVKANILATLTAKIFATMVAEGAEISEIVETITSTLPVCSERGVAYSTFSVLIIYNSGMAHLIEYENPNAIILRGGKNLHLDKTEITVGGKDLKECHFQMQDGDMCIMFSDGAPHAGVGMLLNLGWQRKNIKEYAERVYEEGISPLVFAKLLSGACNSLYMGKAGDDTTFVVARCKERLPCTVMIGPPIERGMDKVMVDKLMSTEGRRVVCGGTTSTIVSRLLDKPLEISLDYFSKEVPPTASIEGIDLVCEGVLTVKVAADLIEKYEQNKISLREIVRLQKKDGAARLCRILIDDATDITFLSGRAVNPAHQNPDLVLNLSNKLSYIERMATSLRKIGKNVTVEYY